MYESSHIKFIVSVLHCFKFQQIKIGAESAGRDLPQRQEIDADTHSKISSNISNNRNTKNNLYGAVCFPAPRNFPEVY